MTYKVKGQGRKVRDASDRFWPISREIIITESQKHQNRKVAQPTGSNAHQFQGQRSRLSGRLILRPEVRHIFRMKKIYELQTWYTGVVRTPRSQRSAIVTKVKGQGCDVTWCVWQGERCFWGHAWRTRTPISREQKVPETPKLIGIFGHAKSNNVIQFQGQKGKGQGQLLLRPKVFHITDFNCQDQLYRPVKFGSCTRV